MSPARLVMTLNAIASRHGIGRVDMVENRFVGMKARGVYETPGGTLIHVAHQDLEGITLDRMTMRIRDQILPAYADAVYNGFWFSPEREAMQALIDKAQERVSARPASSCTRARPGRWGASRPTRCTAMTSPP